MKFSQIMLICFYGLAICDWILALPEPKCELNRTLDLSDYDPIDLTVDPIMSAEVKALEKQMEVINFIVFWPFRFIGSLIKEDIQRLQDNIAVLSDLERRNLKILKKRQDLDLKMDEHEDGDQMYAYQNREPKAYRRPKSHKNVTPFEPWLSLQTPTENLLPFQEHHITVFETHHFRLHNQTLIASY
ncbi:uncharacterized protein LOC108030412 [Drosophila biarmipes]|uniref:uncharacterized protein LOC108030412 n=1 Tax=Drosophila biarmipes TaxID=125945 RepID=UPI0007E710AE|nr:uncharacterized protein LOC108030412 [Drosophila biarmipes]